MSRAVDATLRRLRRWPLIYCWLPLIAWMGLIFWFSSRPRPFDLPDPWLQTLVAKLGHVIGYAGLSLLWWRALAASRVEPQRRKLALAFLLSLLYGVSDEVHQAFVPGRIGNPADVLVDAAGAGLGLWLLRRWQRGRAVKLGT